MHKSKKKAKSVNLPKPIKVKKEKTEEDRTPQPMSHYIDDRLELVKQIFGSLKPKTITNLAPDFLKKKSLDEIEELCLNELLGISTKRLLSIINATKCPTDTESSSDSDVHNIEEHISLEEISSDSEIEGKSSNTTKKKSGGASASKKDGKNASENNENDGQMSVLELLELQARARAIRSQLALEPVTKIEVDSDEEGDDIASNRSKGSRSSGQKERKRKSNDQSLSSAKSSKDTSNGDSSRTANKSKSNGLGDSSSGTHKKIKLKRNFRTNRESSVSQDKPEDSVQKKSIDNKEGNKKQSRSPSPDVIPIVSEPVTLLITDSSDEDAGAAASTTAQATTRDKTIEKPSEEPSKLGDTEPEIKTRRERKITDPEDGEIIDDEYISINGDDTTQEAARTEATDLKSAETSITESIETPTKSNDTDEARNEEQETPTTENVCNEENEKSAQPSESLESTDSVTDKPGPEESNGEANPTLKDQVQDNENTAEESKKPESNVDEEKAVEPVEDEYDDQNDDIISIEGGDLESEMIEHLQEDSKTQAETFNSAVIVSMKKEHVEEDIISLDSSDDELNKESSESWNSRWLKSSKVSKVLATSRLGKRVRDKIKKSKRAKKDSTREAAEAAEAANKTSSSYTSKHEDGSVEQYKELLEMRQRKT